MRLDHGASVLVTVVGLYGGQSGPFGVLPAAAVLGAVFGPANAFIGVADAAVFFAAQLHDEMIVGLPLVFGFKVHLL